MAVDQIDGGEEAAARIGANAAPGDGDRQTGIARASSDDENRIALPDDEGAAESISRKPNRLDGA